MEKVYEMHEIRILIVLLLLAGNSTIVSNWAVLLETSQMCGVSKIAVAIFWTNPRIQDWQYTSNRPNNPTGGMMAFLWVDRMITTIPLVKIAGFHRVGRCW